MQEKFINYYKKTKEDINREIDSLNTMLLTGNSSLVNDDFKLLANLNADGKRVRGTLVNLGYYLLKDDSEYALSLALAYEMFQTAILVHDDIIDNDGERRGVPTIHYANYLKYRNYNDKEAKHLGDSIAICMGDYGLFMANKIVSLKYADNKNLGKILSNFNDTILTTIRGELIDVILPFHSKNNLLDSSEIESNILDIYRLKTAYYTIIGPLSVGIILAGGSDDYIKDISIFGEKVGIAFQIQDDILGIYSDEMGKVKGSDIREFKQTILFSHIINTEYKDEFLSYYGKEDLNDTNILKIQELFKNSGSLAYAESMMNTYYDEALEILNNIKWINDDKKDLLRGFVEYLRNRNK